MLAAFIVFLIIYRWWKKERELYETLWKVKYSDLNFNIARGPISQTAISTLGSKLSINDSDNRSEYSTGNVSGYSNMRPDNMIMISQMFTLVARLNGDQVAVKKVRKKSIREDKLLLKEMKIMKSLKHTNLATFHGACTEGPNICVLWEYCSKGSLEDILHNTDIKLESMFQFSLALDICTGLNYLHTSELGHHGHLKTSNCVVDSRWVAKLTDFGLQRFKKGEKPAEDTSSDKYYTDLFWTAPEVLRCILNNVKYVETKEADIYSLGIVLKQLLCKNTAYNEELNTMTSKEIILTVANNNEECDMFRPYITSEFPEHQAVMMSFVSLIRNCWAENPTERPNIKRVLNTMKRLSPLKMTGVLDNMLALMERYSTRLEDLVSERTIQLEEEKRKTETLLYRMLPRKVADDLKAGQHVQAEAFQDVTIYFSDIVGFTTLAGESTPMEVETIGDAYMTVCGCPEPNPDHAPVMADMSLALLDSVIHFVIPHRPNNQLRIRIGLNSGPVVAGVVGNTMPRYCLFGNTVNLASRMESQGMPQCIQISYFTYELLKKDPDFIMVPRGLVEIKFELLNLTPLFTEVSLDLLSMAIQKHPFAMEKDLGKGKMPTYWLKGRRSTMQLHLETDDISRSANGANFNIPKQNNDHSNTGDINASSHAQDKIAPNQIQPSNQECTPLLPAAAHLNDDAPSNLLTPSKTNFHDNPQYPQINNNQRCDLNSDKQSTPDDSITNSGNTDQFWADNFRCKMNNSGKPNSSLNKDSSLVLGYQHSSDQQLHLTKNYSVMSFDSNNSFTRMSPFERSIDNDIDSMNNLNHASSKPKTTHGNDGTLSPLHYKEAPSSKTYFAPFKQPNSVTNHLPISHRPNEYSPKLANSKTGHHHHSSSAKISSGQSSPLINATNTHMKSHSEVKHKKHEPDKKILGGKDSSRTRSNSCSNSFHDRHVSYLSEEDIHDRRAVFYSPKTILKKKSPIHYLPGRDHNLKHENLQTEYSNGFDIDKSDSDDGVDLVKVSNLTDSKVSYMTKSKKDPISKHAGHNSLTRHSPTKKPHDHFGNHSSDRNQLLNSYWSENVSSHAQAKTYEV
ncbi:Nitrogen permease reactivator protein [Bulinus truncatus]|nr:Nitrogen permease reactivator protein [Bulinus truncatus]